MTALRLLQSTKLSNTGRKTQRKNNSKLQLYKRNARRGYNRGFKTHINLESNSSNWLLLASLGVAGSLVLLSLQQEADAATVDYNAVRDAIAALLHNEKYDDGSYGPLFVRLAWHASGTYCRHTGTGGSKHGTIRFSPGEADHGANAGLGVARNILDPLIARFPGLSYADLYTLAGVVAIEQMGGPKIPWTPGRKDGAPSQGTPDGRLPDATKDQTHIREIFYRMGFNDREIVALSGAHALGRCHRDRSGFEGPWTASPTVFSNDYFIQLTERTWTPRKWDGPFQYQDETGQLMMLPTDLALLKDENFAVIARQYAADEEVFFRDFAAAFGKLLALGTN